LVKFLNMNTRSILALLFCFFFVFLAPVQAGKSAEVGVLILAHGHEQEWNRQVHQLASSLPFPTAVALGMAHRNTIAQAVSRLEREGVRHIVAVPLYVSSYSPIVRSSAYLLGLSHEAPLELAEFNSMRHGLQDPHAEHGGAADVSPIQSRVPICMTSALDDHPLVAQILLARARSISRKPEKERVILVAHGPVSEADNKLWLQKMARLADFIQKDSRFSRVEVATLMDDAAVELRDRATAKLRAQVKEASEQGEALVVPVLLSRGGIEDRLEKRLRGLKYRMPAQFLLPDPRIGEWVKEQVEMAIAGKLTTKPSS
jgi:sirohydrochlorin ferrochelatase